MIISRRDFLKYCSISAGALGLTATDLARIGKAMAVEGIANGGIPVVWLQGQNCTGCSTSLLNEIYYTSVENLLIDTPVDEKGLDLNYHATLMASAGANAKQAAEDTLAGPFVLVVEGAIPMGADGEYCTIWADADGTNEETILHAIRRFAIDTDTSYNSNNNAMSRIRPLFILSVGTCAAFGGIPAAKPNPTSARSVYNALIPEAWMKNKTQNQQYNGWGVGTNANAPSVAELKELRKRIINIGGCPPHPDWIVGTIAYILGNLDVETLVEALNEKNYTAINKVLTDAKPPVDALRRPVDFYYQRQCDNCKRFTQPFGCLKMIGCKGMRTKADCSVRLWNKEPGYDNTGNWCAEAGYPCVGCSQDGFPDKMSPFFKAR